jgi:hypothetical protein
MHEVFRVKRWTLDQTDASLLHHCTSADEAENESSSPELSEHSSYIKCRITSYGPHTTPTQQATRIEQLSKLFCS